RAEPATACDRVSSGIERVADRHGHQARVQRHRQRRDLPRELRGTVPRIGVALPGDRSGDLLDEPGLTISRRPETAEMTHIHTVDSQVMGSARYQYRLPVEKPS